MGQIINNGNFIAYENEKSGEGQVLKGYGGSINTYNKVDFLREVAKGNVIGHQYARIFGTNQHISVSTEETIYMLSSNYSFATSGETLYISSSSTSDVNITFNVVGLDINMNEITGKATLNGQNKVEVIGNTNPFYRVNSFIADNDSLTQNVGNVYLYADTTVTNGVPITSFIRDFIEIDYMRAMKAIYTVPIDKVLFLHQISASCSRNADFTIRFKYRVWDSINKLNKAFITSSLNSIGESHYDLTYSIPLYFQGGFELEITAISSVNNTKISVTLDGILIDKDNL